MRLTPDEIAAIKECAAAHFGEGAVVRLFGSRLRDDLRGGDIDLHITTDGGDDAPSASFLAELEQRIGNDRIDVLHLARTGPRRPIDEIALLTGEVLAGEQGDPFEVDGEQRMRMARHAYRQLVADAVAGGRRAEGRLERTLSELRDTLPLDAVRIESLSRIQQLETDSLLLQFSNLAAIVRDQLLRAILLAQDGKLQSRERPEQQLRAEELGIIPKGLAFEAIAKARNRVAHQYPADPAKQAEIVNQVAAAVPLAIQAFDALATYAEAHLLPPDAPNRSGDEG